MNNGMFAISWYIVIRFFAQRSSPSLLSLPRLLLQSLQEFGAHGEGTTTGHMAFRCAGDVRGHLVR